MAMKQIISFFDFLGELNQIKFNVVSVTKFFFPKFIILQIKGDAREPSIEDMTRNKVQEFSADYKFMCKPKKFTL